MKKRDVFWVNRIVVFFTVTIVFGIISLFNILLFNSSYMEEEHEELSVFKKQIEWVIIPFIEQKNFSKIEQYCEDFKLQDIEFRIFDENKNLIASTNPQNTTPLIEKNSEILNKKYSKFKIYKLALKNRKIGVREKYKIDGKAYYLELTVSQADVMKAILNVQKNALIFLAICLLFIISLLIQNFSTLRKSFNKLEDSVIDVANGNLDANIEIPSINLLEELTISIKKMVKKLKLQIARLSQLEEYKNNFLQNITHEIKTPITAINSAIELLEAKNSLSENDSECFDIIRFQIKSIDKLVNDILCLSEIEVEKTNENKNFKTFNLNSMIERVIAYMSFTEIKINFIQKDQVEIFANEELLSTAISNLLSNAIRYSGTEKIDVSLEKSGDFVQISVKDYGVGIAEEHLEHIFERFYRVDKNRSRKLGGTGLGLAIVKNIIELHNGSVSVESKVGKGTCFICKM